MEDSHPLILVHERLRSLAILADQVKKAVHHADYRIIRPLVHRFRKERAELGDVRDKLGSAPPPMTPRGIETLVQMREFTERIRLGEEAAKAWFQRPLPPDEELLETQEGIELMVDVLLPPTWDVEKDVVVLLGTGGERVAAELVARGQKRLLIYLVGEDPSGGYPDEAIVIRNLIDLRNAVITYPGAMPDHSTSKKLPDPRVSKELLSEVSDMVREALQALRVRRNTLDAFGEVWVLQGIQNFPSIASWPSIEALRSQFKGIPAVIIAPGPSLAKNVHLIPQLKGKALLITFSHTLHALQAAGVVPDLVMALDPEDLRYHFEGIPIPEFEGMVLATTIHPEVFRFPARRVFTYAGNSQLDDWIYECLGDDARLSSGGSVATSALSLALLWRCDPIIFVGQDLAFSNGQYYVRSSCDGDTRLVLDDSGHYFSTEGYSDGFSKMATIGGAKQTKAERLALVPGYYGGKAQTSLTSQLFLSWFKTVAKTLKDKVRMFNCTEGGAFIEGMEHVPLADAITRFCQEPVDVPAILEDAMRRNDRRGRQAKMRNRLAEIVEYLDACVEHAKRATELAEKAKHDQAVLSRLDEAEKELTKLLKPVLFISLLRQAEIRNAREAAKDAKTLHESLGASQRLFSVISMAGELLRPYLGSSLEALEKLVAEPATPSDR
ncbi:MAG: motility associated factor glycosyltransferase family protein [Deltaproteobacteria bacterium]|nr:motility associated factor glycosyltransferase family protein [Deltaproteobacteria bacterium]